MTIKAVDGGGAGLERHDSGRLVKKKKATYLQQTLKLKPWPR